MNDHIVPLRGGSAPKEPVAEVVETLEDLLEQAREGRIRGVAYAMVRSEGQGFTTGWDGEGGVRDRIGNAISYLQTRFYTEAYKD